MSTRVGGGGLGHLLNPFGPEWPRGSGAVDSIGSQLQGALFGKSKPPLLDPAHYPLLWAQLMRLMRDGGRIANMIGEPAASYRAALADSPTAMIDAEGLIYFGAGLLKQYEGCLDVLVGILGHEIGHRPRRWGGLRVSGEPTRQALLELCRQAEDEADTIAGLGLGELQRSPEPLVRFLIENEDRVRPHPEYYPASVRARTIVAAHGSRSFRVRFRKALSPALAREGARLHLGDF